jgi:outer membrane protein assembly factor BamB
MSYFESKKNSVKTLLMALSKGEDNMRKFTALLVVVALLVPAFILTATTNSDWPNMFNDPSHTNYQPDTTIPDVMQREWVYYPENGTIASHIAIDDKIIFGTSQGVIVCLEQSDGRELWSYKVGEIGSAQIGYVDGKIVFICTSYMQAGGGEDGSGGGGHGGGRPGGGGHPMSTTEETEVSSVIGMISPENGAEIFKEVIKKPTTISGGLVGEEYIYLAYTEIGEDRTIGNTRFVCMDPNNQSEVWSADLDRMPLMMLTYGDGKIFTSVAKIKMNPDNPMPEINDSAVIAFDEEGKIAWEKKLDESEIAGGISYADGRIYFSKMKVPSEIGGRRMVMPTSELMACNAENGEDIWVFDISSIDYANERTVDFCLYGIPAITPRGIVLQLAMSHTICVSKNKGSLVWKNETPGGMAFTCMQFACTKDKVISTRGTKFSIANITDGEIVFTDDTMMSGGMPFGGGSMIMPMPVIANDKVFVSGDRIICYGEKVVGLYSDPSTIRINQIYPDEVKTRNVRVYYNDTGEINGTLTPSDDWISLSSTEYVTLSQTYEVTLSAEGMEPGMHSGSIDVESSVGNLSIPIEMNVVAKPPIKLDIDLDDTTITNEDSFKVEGTTVPGATLSVNGRPVTVKTDGTFSDMIPIDEGRNELKFHAEDADGNAADVIKVVILDTRRPIIRTTIKEGQKIVSLPFEFQGATERGARLMVNDEPIEVSANGEFSVILKDLEDGEYTINMVSKDKAGNVFKLNRTVIIDATKIPLELDLPEPGFAGSQTTTYTLKGKTSPNHSVVALIDNVPVGYCQSDEEGSFELEITVEGDGQYNVTVIASTMSEKTSDPTPFTLIVDSQPPAIECDIPELVSQSPVTLEGTTEPMAKVFINGQEASVDLEGNFSFEIELNSGLNAVTVKAVDTLGNESTIDSYIKFETVETIRLKLWVNEPKFVINNKQADDLDPMPTTKSPPLPAELAGNSYMPVRAVFEALGATVDWIDADRRVDVTLGNTFLQLWVDNVSTAKINGVETTIIGADGQTVLYPTIVNGRTMLPLRFACESLGADVNWIAEESAIEVVYPSEK